MSPGSDPLLERALPGFFILRQSFALYLSI